MFDKRVAIQNAEDKVEQAKARLINAHYAGDFSAIERGKRDLASAQATLRSVKNL